VYGVQWRNWRSPIFKGAYSYTETDQLRKLIDGLIADPTSRRHIISAWNPGEIDQMALPPCHAFMQFYIRNNKLSCQMYQRSGDVPLGIPFNIASYSLFTHMIAHTCKFEVGEFIHVIGDAHIYKNQIEGIQEQLTRKPLLLPKLWLNPNVTDITKFTMDDIKLIDYQSHPAINFPFAT
jgi:thymidylate synthase